MRMWAVEVRYLDADNHWHRHTTRWYDNAADPWCDAEEFQEKYKDKIMESQSSLVHKEM